MDANQKKDPAPQTSPVKTPKSIHVSLKQLEGQEVKFFQFGDDCGLFSGESMVGKLEIENRQVKILNEEGARKKRKATREEISK